MFTQFVEGGSELVVMKTNGSGRHTILKSKGFPNHADWGTHP